MSTAWLRLSGWNRVKTTFWTLLRRFGLSLLRASTIESWLRSWKWWLGGELKRLIINMPPRHTKSEFASYLFPAWMIGKNPAMKIIQATHTTELAVNFGRKVKNLIERDDYSEVFPDAKLADSKASGRWDTDRGGMYYAVGVA